MKKLLVAVFVIIIIGLALPIFGGFKAKQELDYFIEYINSQPGYRAHWLSYDRGWFHSTARLQLESDFLSVLSSPADAGFIPVDLSLQHGPLLFGHGSKLGWFAGSSSLSIQPDSLLEQVEVKNPEEPIWKTEFWMALNGTTHFQDSSQAAKLQLQGERIESTAFTGKGILKRSGELSYSGELPQLSLSGEDMDLSMEQLQVDVAVELKRIDIDHSFAPGHMSLKVARLEGAGSEINDFTLSNLSMDSKTSLNDTSTLVDTTVTAGFDELSLESNQIDDFNLDISLQNISVAFIRKYSEAMADINGPSEASAAMGLDMLGMATTELLPHGPVFKVNDFSFASDKGGMKLNGQALVPASNDGQRVNPFAVFQSIQISTEFQADKTLVLAMLAQSNQEAALQAVQESNPLATQEDVALQALELAATQLDLFKLQGMLIESNDQISAKFTFQNGVATLNDNPMPLPF